jgi:hypothetical protein
MKRAILAASVLATGAMLAVSGVAAPPNASQKGAHSSAGDAPTVQNLGGLEKSMRGLRWGMTHDEVTHAYNDVGGLFDQEYSSQLMHVQPGYEQQQLEADRDNRKVNLERSYALFGDSPTGYDTTPLKNEYTYRNDEALQKLFKDGRQRYLFYIKDKLWKIYEEIPLKADGPLGATFQDAVAKLNAAMAVPARIRPVDSSQGLDRTTADWQDRTTHVRALDRSSEHLIGLSLEDKNTLSNIASLRTAKVVDQFAIDPSIAAITRHGISDPSAAHDANGDSALDGGKRKKAK